MFSKHTYNRGAAVQVLGNRGPLSARDPGQVFATSARDCKIPQHGDDLEAVTAPPAKA